MSIPFSSARSYRAPAIRKYILAFAGILAVSACWLVVPQLYLLRGPSADVDRTAAAIAVIRSDLWARSAALDLSGQPSWQITASRRAVRLDPVQASAWLRLALASLSSEPERAAAELKMSFYTGPAEDQLIPEYLKLIGGLDLSSDDELQYLAERQIDKVLHHHPDLRPDVIAMYRKTSSKNQSVIEKLVTATEPQFTPGLRAPR